MKNQQTAAYPVQGLFILAILCYVLFSFAKHRGSRTLQIKDKNQVQAAKYEPGLGTYGRSLGMNNVTAQDSIGRN